jgi:hypothetical protein
MVKNDTFDPCPSVDCDGHVRKHTIPGRRPYMARFAEPDETMLTCDTCGFQFDEDEVASAKLAKIDG